jgi:hypothetical protein
LSDPPTLRHARAAAVTLLLVMACLFGQVVAQAVTVSVNGDALHVKAPAFNFMSGEVLRRLKDGRSVRLELELAVRSRPSPDAAPVTRVSQAFVLSYDLWEERFAVTHARTPPLSISHLTAGDAETWCLERLTVPTGALASLGKSAALWIRLAYRVPGTDGGVSSDGDGDGFTLRGLIDRLSRRRVAADLRDSIDAGPFRLP